jgi:hypothetical protein
MAVKRHSNNKGILLIAFLLFAVVVGALVFRKYETATRKLEPPPKAAPAVGSVVVTLFFASADGQGLAREGREVEIEEGIEDGVESVVDELISGPLGSLAPTLPPNVKVLGVQVKGDVAQIDFGHELRDSLPAGSSAGMTAVYSIVDTVTLNFPKIKAVQLLIDGAPAQELKELDISTPLSPDYSLEKKEQPAQAGK